MSLILAVNSGIGGSVGVFRDGKPIFCVEEERFNRVKNWMGRPEQALRYILAQEIATPDTVSHVAIVNHNGVAHSREAFYQGYEEAYANAAATLDRETAASGARRRSLARRVIGPLTRPVRRFVRQLVQGDGTASPPLSSFSPDQTAYPVAEARTVDERLLQELGFSPRTMTRVMHEYCHAAAAYHGLARHLDDPYLVLSLDGGGDYYSCTVWRGQGGRLQRLAAASSYSIGNMYSAVTHFLGFTPHEHEYKLMGLAPYVRAKYFEPHLAFFRRFLRLSSDGMTFENPTPIIHPHFMWHLMHEIRHPRFDSLAAGLQAFTEEIVLAWVQSLIAHTGIHKLVCAGGVFMNVKLNQRIAQLPEVEFVDVFPSCGDESNIFGAAWYLANENADKQVGMLKSYTVGTSPENASDAVYQKFAGRIVLESVDEPNKTIARLLLAGQIIARCTGPMEFGARALGNRSILADPRNLATVNKINRAIKNRDFWMPFAPAVLWDRAEELLIVPAALRLQGSPYMMFTFDTRPERREDMACGLHQADHTARAQTVDSQRYPDLDEIIRHFHDATGIPAILNTSFNLHGHPIVENAEQAIEVLLDSNLDAVVIGNKVVRKKA